MELGIAFGIVVVVGVIVALAKQTKYRAEGHTDDMNPSGLRPHNWRSRTDGKGNLTVTITDYGLTQRKSRTYKIAAGTPQTAVPMEARQAAQKARKAGWK
jgi:hypothetical protein